MVEESDAAVSPCAVYVVGWACWLGDGLMGFVWVVAGPTGTGAGLPSELGGYKMKDAAGVGGAGARAAAEGAGAEILGA